MSWIYLLIAGLGEIGFVVFMKLSNGFKSAFYSLLTLVSALFSFYFLSIALLTIPLGTGYAVWTGIGAAGSVVIGMIIFKESKAPRRILFLCLIIIGVIGLRFVSPH
ncbi:quaternary ammonium compound-resistance protein SugE [Peribacillus deserti]|uniref:Quaternary ammonium compound-resistance protein SugE n=1 Tax=Peribacillus deserti TaxID=673318 RepID=A0ABS2QN40_9BACI|nr:multidrug efflux SMR transporter [Peribacillus deserti]MBM7694576.1 quaternary ammonium compound-resistance protein SugE [Peribacillus deserti]